MFEHHSLVFLYISAFEDIWNSYNRPPENLLSRLTVFKNKFDRPTPSQFNLIHMIKVFWLGKKLGDSFKNGDQILEARLNACFALPDNGFVCGITSSQHWLHAKIMGYANKYYLGFAKDRTTWQEHIRFVFTMFILTTTIFHEIRSELRNMTSINIFDCNFLSCA